MLIVKRTGLVPVIGLKGRTGRFGLKPAAAAEAFLAGAVKFAPRAEGIEYNEIPDPVKPDAAPPPDKVALIPIPDDWETMHPMKQIVLAEKLSGVKIELTEAHKEDGVKKSDLALPIIRDEVQRRAAAAQPAG